MLQLPFYYILKQEISTGMRAMRKKLNIFMLQLPIYYILQQEISTGANVDNAKIKQEKQIVFVEERSMQCLLLQVKPQSARKASHNADFKSN